MIRRPFAAEWDTSDLPENRRAYLERGLSLEQMAARVLTEGLIIGCKIRPYKTPAPGEARDARQVIFLVRVNHEVCDLLYNARDGLRARYWQSPEHGFLATRHLIETLLPALMLFTERNPPTPTCEAAPMEAKDIRASLEAPSAKIWPQEGDDQGTWLSADDDRLRVPRWHQNEQWAQINIGMWRKSPTGAELEIKGALLGRDATEFIPEGKRDRSCQIHRFGFT